MEAKELRIGNLLTLDDKVRQELFYNSEINARNKYFKVLTIYSDGDILLELDDENVEIDIKDIEPIPLTEEWLLKFGFDKFNNHCFLHNYNQQGKLYIFSNNSPVAIANKVTEPFYYMFNGLIHVVKYVHQFQNIYFALKGDELIIKS